MKKSKNYKKLASISVNSWLKTKNPSEIEEEFHWVKEKTMKKSKNSGTVLKFGLPGILIFAFCLLTFAFPNMALAQGGGKALEFDGVDDYVDVSGVGSYTTGFTWSAWFNTATITSGYTAIIGYRECLNQYAMDNKVHIYANDGSWHLLESNTIISADTWYLYTAVHDGSTLKLYINGVYDTEIPCSTLNPIDPDTHIGLRANDAAPFKGTIDEVRIWNVALTEAQIREMMCKEINSSNLPSGLAWSSLKGYWRFDESSGTSCADSSPNSNIGTMYNMDDADHVWSGAALGDASDCDYTGAAFGEFSATVSHTDGDDITATGDGGTFTGIQVYRVDATSMRTDATKPGAAWTMDPERYWGVFAVGTSPTYTVVYNYDGHPGISDQSDLGLAVRDNHADNSWADLGATLDQGANTLTKAGQSGTEYALGSKEGDNTLPVELSTFTAQFLENIPTIYWTTQSEIDNMGWFVYRNEENDFTTSEKISVFIDGHGTTSQQQSYIYEDNIDNPKVGDIYYYWLESIDYSGMVNHYDRVAIMQISEGHDQEPQIAFPLKYGLQYGPNPFNSNLNIIYMLRKSDMVRVEIYNIHGQLLSEFDEGQSTKDKMYKLKWNGQDLYGKDVSSGVLLIKLITTEGSETKKAILIR